MAAAGVVLVSPGRLLGPALLQATATERQAGQGCTPHHASVWSATSHETNLRFDLPLQLWDDLCEALRVREISTEDVSNKASCAGFLLRV